MRGEREVDYRTKSQGPPPGYRRCHASCCQGETELDATVFGTPHDMQAILDRARFGFASGFFGERHGAVLKAMQRAFAEGVAVAGRHDDGARACGRGTGEGGAKADARGSGRSREEDPRRGIPPTTTPRACPGDSPSNRRADAPGARRVPGGDWANGRGCCPCEHPGNKGVSPGLYKIPWGIL